MNTDILSQLAGNIVLHLARVPEATDAEKHTIVSKMLSATLHPLKIIRANQPHQTLGEILLLPDGQRGLYMGNGRIAYVDTET